MKALTLILIVVGLGTLGACDSKNAPAPATDPTSSTTSGTNANDVAHQGSPLAAAESWIQGHKKLDATNTAILKSWSQPTVLRMLKTGDTYTALVGDDSEDSKDVLSLTLTPLNDVWQVSAVKPAKSDDHWPTL